MTHGETEAATPAPAVEAGGEVDAAATSSAGEREDPRGDAVLGRRVPVRKRKGKGKKGKKGKRSGVKRKRSPRVAGRSRAATKNRRAE